MSRRQNRKRKAVVKVRRRKMNVGHIQWRNLDTDKEPPSVNDYISSLRMTPKQYVNKLREIVKDYDIMIMDSGA